MAELRKALIVIAIAATLLMSVADVGAPELVVLLAIYGVLLVTYRVIRRRSQLRSTAGMLKT